MKETRKFFDNNKLNKGYTNNNKVSQAKPSYTQVNQVRSQGNNFLPPPEIMAAYEEIYPGATLKLFQIAEEEQKHRHRAELAKIEQYQKVNKFGICFGFMKFVFVITLILLVIGNSLSAAVLMLIALGLCTVGIFSKNTFAGLFKKHSEKKTSDKPAYNKPYKYKGHNQKK